jgi:hypothetical protein
MVFGIVGVMKIDVVTEEPATNRMVTQFVMQKRLDK